MKSFLRSGLLLAAIGLTVFTSCRRDGDENGQTSETKIDHLLIQEVYYGGTYFTRTYDGKEYNDAYDEDKYIRIYNPTSKTIYLDNYALAAHPFDPCDRIDLKDEYNFIKTHFGVSTIVLFGGSGTQHPLAAGASVVIAKKAINHRTNREKYLVENGEDLKNYKRLDQLLDLSKADYQWIPKEGVMGVGSNVHEMMLWYSQGEWKKDEMSNFDVSNKTAIALIKLGDTPENIKQTFIKESNYTKAEDIAKRKYCKNIAYKSNGHHNKEATLLIMPYEWVVDVVTICPNTEFKWSLVDTKVDKGHKGVQETTNDKINKYAGKALVRRFDGNKFVDNNNSTSDFEVVEASFFLKKK